MIGMEIEETIKEAIDIIDECATELDEFCCDICTAEQCYLCNVRDIIDKLAEAIKLLEKVIKQ